MRYRYILCDVFTDRRFGGNQLAVVPEASGLSTAQMLQITREFNFSESAFVLPATGGGTRQVRIFTPAGELPFAGHPNIGTAYALAQGGAFGDFEQTTVVFEELAGPVPIHIRRLGQDRFLCELTAPEPLSVGAAIDPALVAAATGLNADQVSGGTAQPRQVSVGLPFLLAEVADRAALQQARPNRAGFEALVAAAVPRPHLLLYTRSDDEFDLRVRMFAPLDGIAEDAATGSANCALAGWLADRDTLDEGELRYRIAQGVEMGRPSELQARVRKQAGKVSTVHIGGESVLFAEGELIIS